MKLLDLLFKKEKPKQLEDDFKVTITDILIKVEYPNKNSEQVLWTNIQAIKLLNTDEGPWLPDVWLVLIGQNDGCMIPQGAKGFDEIYDIVSKYENFNFENAIKSMSCTDNAEFLLWTKEYGR